MCSLAQGVEIDGCIITRYFNNHGSSRTFWAYGNVYVETDPKELVDMKVEVVSNPTHADFHIYRTSDTPNSCGEWRFVKNKADAKFTIRFVDDYADCYIYYVKDRKDADACFLARQR